MYLVSESKYNHSESLSWFHNARGVKHTDIHKSRPWVIGCRILYQNCVQKSQCLRSWNDLSSDYMSPSLLNNYHINCECTAVFKYKAESAVQDLGQYLSQLNNSKLHAILKIKLLKSHIQSHFTFRMIICPPTQGQLRSLDEDLRKYKKRELTARRIFHWLFIYFTEKRRFGAAKVGARK